ncbi:MAG: TMEM165/GDT1 family protein [Synechococcaceae cyanobacterium ELA445]|jgi:putative Ca2+/H+ antiporter (TMEM165/GDT1 family)
MGEDLQPASTQAPSQGDPAAESGSLGLTSAGGWGAVFLTTATTVFLAELGDKTQLAALLLSAQSGEPVVVFIGASLALVCSSLVGVLLGRWLAGLMPAHQLERLAGILMVGLGLWIGRQAVISLMTS